VAAAVFMSGSFRFGTFGTTCPSGGMVFNRIPSDLAALSLTAAAKKPV
jgi:hypothetical protein